MHRDIAYCKSWHTVDIIGGQKNDERSKSSLWEIK